MKPKGKLVFFVLTFLALAANAYALSPREEFQQMVEKLQKSPADTALRKQIIALAQELNPAPAIPEQAREPFVIGSTVLKKTSDPAGVNKAVDFFTQALNIAPWFADAYYNRAIANETAGQFEAAIDDLKTYLEFKLTDTERREVQDKIYTLKADVQLSSTKKTEQDKIASAEETKRQAELQAAAQEQRFVSNWYRIVELGGGQPFRQSFMINRDLHGNLRLSGLMVDGEETYDVRLEGAEFKFKDVNQITGTVEFSGSLSADGSRLRFTSRGLPSSPSQMEMRALMGFTPNRFGGEEWLKE